ncbi:L-threonylcarbamoyladenylate synthase [Candidatus Dependentiae bacterium]|nr:L-threonylcarbamoyladenylate synthase [Candidatus Dependentiae bacterium]
MQSNSLSWYDKNTVQKACKVINQNGVVLSTTDTVLGLLATTSVEGRKVIDNMKRRYEKPYLILVDSAKKINSLVDVQSMFHIEKLIAHCWPGPVTLIVNARKDVPAYMKSNQNTIALRVPDHKQLCELLLCTGPLFSTSANKADQPVPDTIKEVDSEILAACALIIGCASSSVKTLNDEAIQSVSSTILDCTTKNIRIVREGAYCINKLETFYGKPFVRRV